MRGEPSGQHDRIALTAACRSHQIDHALGSGLRNLLVSTINNLKAGQAGYALYGPGTQHRGLVFVVVRGGLVCFGNCHCPHVKVQRSVFEGLIRICGVLFLQIKVPELFRVLVALDEAPGLVCPRPGNCVLKGSLVELYRLLSLDAT